jgi:dolichyl-phosphate beta-glucosyltransferase
MLEADVDIPYKHIVVGDRTLQGSKYFTEVPWIRNIGNKFYSFIVGRFVVSGLFNTQCGIKGFRAEVAEDIFQVPQINRFAIDVEILCIVLKRIYDTKRFPVDLRIWAPSQIRANLDGGKLLVDLLIIWLNYQLGRYKAQREISLIIDSYHGYKR